MGVIALAAALAAGCAAGAPPREEVLADLADEVIVPAMERLRDDTATLAARVSELCDTLTPDALAETRLALAGARAAWSYSEAMWAGPVTERRSWALIDWPIAADEIEELIADTSIELDDDRLSRRIGADQRGLGAVEHVIGMPGGDAAVLEALADPRRCEYLTGISAVIAAEAALLPRHWTVDFEDGGPYRAVLADAGGMGIDAVVNGCWFLLEAMSDIELGLALWSIDRQADLDTIDEGPLGLGAADLAQHLRGLRHVLVGDAGDSGNSGGPGGGGSGGAGMAGLRPLLGDDLAGRLVERLDAADRTVAAIDPPLRAAISDDPETVTAARDAIDAVQVTVATEVISRLGVTIGFSDADGDTGA